jgi:hypothetical protein
VRHGALSLVPILVPALLVLAASPSGASAPWPGAASSDAASSSPSDPYGALLDDVESDQDLNQVLDLIDTALKQPVNLASASRDEIGRLPWVSPGLADAIVALRARGDLKTIDDLKRIPGVTDALVDRLRPFVVLRAVAKRPARVTGLARLRLVASPPTSSAAGLKTNAVCELEAGSLGIGLVADKDKGERRLNDYQACYAEKTLGGARVAAGNFFLASGHGLVFSDASGESPSTADPWRIGRGSFGIKTSTSSAENFLLRGAGLALASGSLDLCVALARTTFDVSLDRAGRVTALNETGSHVAAAEREGRDALREDLLGVACRLVRGRLTLAASLAGSRLNRDLAVARATRRKDEARLQGGLDASIRDRDAIVFAEGALDRDGGALLAGLALDRPRAEVLVLGRTYGSAYLNLHSRPFAAYSGVGTGEQGLLALVKLKPLPAGELTIGSDLHRRDRAESGFGASGSETFATLAVRAGAFGFALGEKFARGEEPPSEAAAAAGTAGGEETTRLRSRLDVTWQPARGARLRARYESVTARREEAGSTDRTDSELARLDLSLDGPHKLSLDAGCSVFTVEGWAARIYQYEAGLPYYPTLELAKSDGSRWYAVVSWDTKSFGLLAAKYGRTIYADGEEHSQVLAAYVFRM